MYYHKWPQTAGTGSHSYSWTVNGTEYTESMDFSTVQFDWNNMLTSYTSSASAAQKSAVAKLMHAVGVAAEMGYTPNSSGAMTNKAAQGLLTYWNYDQGAIGYSRNCFSLDDWSSMIYDELAASRPVIYEGQSTGGGHCFICDGYNASNGYFHFNWGWGGYCDGYYALTDLTPARGGIGGTSSDDGYNMNQSIVVGLQPAQAGSTPRYNLQLTQGLSVDEDLYDKAQYIYVNGRFQNGSLHDMTFTPGIKLVDVNNPSRVIYSIYTPYENYRRYDLPAGYYYNELPVYGTLVPTGTYDLYFVYRISDDGEWQDLLAGPGITNHLRIEANSDYIAFNGATLPAQSKHFMVNDDMVPQQTLYRRGDTMYFTGKYWNQTGNTVNFNPGVKFTSTEDANDVYYFKYQYANWSLDPRYQYSAWYGTSDNEIPNGSYILTPAYYDTDKEVWLDFDRTSSYKDYCSAEINNEYIALDGATLPGEPVRVTNVTVTPTITSDLDGEGTLHYYIGHSYKVTYTIEATGQGASGWSSTLNLYNQIGDADATSLGTGSISASTTYPYTYTKTFTIAKNTDPEECTLTLWRTYNGRKITPLNTLQYTTEYHPETSYLRLDELNLIGTFSENTDGASFDSPFEICKDYGILQMFLHSNSAPYNKTVRLTIYGHQTATSYSSEAYANFTVQCDPGQTRQVQVTLIDRSKLSAPAMFANADDDLIQVPLQYYSGHSALDYNKIYHIDLKDANNTQLTPYVYFKVSDSVLTGVPEITIFDPSEIRYFDLMGREVKNPTNGIYIRVWGNKTDKVVIK